MAVGDEPAGSTRPDRLSYEYQADAKVLEGGRCAGEQQIDPAKRGYGQPAPSGYRVAHGRLVNAPEPAFGCGVGTPWIAPCCEALRDTAQSW
jgi:hypothetical protein